MTAQIGILNKNAIILATDSAVTVGDGNGKKVYKSVNKLFSLSKKKPLAIMVYGNAGLLGVPWETLIKVYRKQLNKDYAKLEDYSNDFMKWLEKESKNIFSKDVQEGYLCRSLYSYYNCVFVEPLSERVKDIEDSGGTIKIEDINKFLEEEIDERNDILKKEKFINGFNSQKRDELIKKYRKQINFVIKELFGNVTLTTKSKKQLVQIAGNFLTREVISEDSYSGIVIAGFGDKELYPTLMEFKIEGVIGNKIIFIQEKKRKIDNEKCSASIVPFAQSDFIYNFMQGVHPVNIAYFKQILDRYPDIIADKLGKILGEISDDQKDAIRRKISKKNDELFEEFMNATDTLFSGPIINMIDLMPITELCEFAESLINLTSLRKKVTMQEESVGGETEVASITKAEGMIWIKRKHYFDPKLNHSFINNYLNI